MGTVTIIAAFFIRQALKPQEKIGSENFSKALFSLLKYAIVFLVAIMAVYFVTNASTGSWGTPLILDGVLMGISCIMIMGVSTNIADNRGGMWAT